VPEAVEASSNMDSLMASLRSLSSSAGFGDGVGEPDCVEESSILDSLIAS